MALDLISAILITYAFYRGYNRGLLKTVVDTLSIVVGIVVALNFSPQFIAYLQKIININPAIEFILGFIIVFFVVMILLRFIADKIESIFKAIKINFINQIAGGVLLGAFTTFIIGSIILLLTNLKIINLDYANQSKMYEFLLSAGQEGGWVMEMFKNLFSDFWNKFITTIDKVKDNLDNH